MQNKPVTIVCPVCIPATKLVVTTDAETGRRYLACPNPDCGHSEDLPPSLSMRATGQKPLFD